MENISEKQLVLLEKECTLLIKRAGQLLLKNFTRKKQITEDLDRHIHSNLDIDVEIFLKNNLGKIFPQAGFILEEHESKEKDHYNWIIDPIDGTNNYIKQAPFFYTQFALLYKKKPVLSQIYQPISDQLFSAVSGRGTTLNRKRIKAVKNRSDPRKSIVDLDMRRGSENLELKIKVFSKLFPIFYRVRMSGGSLAPYLVTGAIDAYLDVFRVGKLFDILPRTLIFEEAGLVTEEVEIEKGKNILICSNRKLLKIIKKLILDSNSK